MNPDAPTYTKLTNFIEKLNEAKIDYRLTSVRGGIVMVQLAIPGERWEIEFMPDGQVEVEKFISSSDGLSGEEVLAELFP